MNWKLLIGSGGLIGVAVMFFYVIRFFIRIENRITNMEMHVNHKIESLEATIIGKLQSFEKNFEYRLSSMGNDIFTMKKSIDEIKSDLRDMNTKMEERTLKVIYTVKPLEEKTINH